MTKSNSIGLQNLLAFAAGLLILKIAVSVVLGYGDYFPPSFQASFLSGRQSYFYGPYGAAFCAHLFAGPITLVFGVVLVSERLRRRFPAWHRALGKSQIVLVSLLLAPSGLLMAFRADGGPVAVAGFAVLALVTAACALFGWRCAIKRRFAEHRRWMTRCFLLLCSAVVIRLIGGLTFVSGWAPDWSYPLSAWISWLGPLAVYEIVGLNWRPVWRSRSGAVPQSVGSSEALSSLDVEISARR